MKKILPTGFTLVELLVVVAIIAILATIGLAVYSGLTARARDSERESEMQQIAQALEINRTASGYQPLQNSWFQADSIPTDPLPSQRVYCIAASTSSTPSIPSSPWTTTCPLTGGYSSVSTSTPAANSIYFRICTSLEIGGVFCRPSSQ